MIAKGFKYLFQCTKDYIDKYPLHSHCVITPLQFHGYKETPENIARCIEECQYEISIYPEYADILLDKINELKIAFNHLKNK